MKKGQVKIQEMAFVLVALAVLFGLVILMYFSIRLNTLQSGAQLFKDDSARALIRSLPSFPELQWAECSSCIDLDKAIAFKALNGNNSVYGTIWELDYLKIERVYPENENKECSIGNYPDCNALTLIDTPKPDSAPVRAFASLCRWDDNFMQEVCELGIIYASGGSVK